MRVEVPSWVIVALTVPLSLTSRSSRFVFTEPMRVAEPPEAVILDVGFFERIVTAPGKFTVAEDRFAASVMVMLGLLIWTSSEVPGFCVMSTDPVRLALRRYIVPSLPDRS